MSRSTDTVVQKLVDEAAAKASAGGVASPGDRATIGAFVRGFYRNVPPAELLPRSPSALADAAQAMWLFIQNRTHGEARIEAHATAPGRGVVHLLNDDRRFLVDSVAAALVGLGFEIDLVIHPVMRVRRDDAGHLLACCPDGTAGAPESMMRVEVIGDLAEDRRDAVIARLRDVLADVRAVVDDWQIMRTQVHEIAERTAQLRHPFTATGATDAAEDAAFVAWLERDNFLFLGTREYIFHGTELDIVAGVGRGLLRNDNVQVFDGLRAITRASPDVQAFLRTPQLTMISKSTRRSTVHRPAPMDTIIVKTMDEAGAVNGLRLILGLFTRDSYARLPAEVPVLRQKVRRCHERSGFPSDSRDGRALQHILDTFPRDELFQIDETQLFETAIGVMHLQQRARVALFVMRDPFERFVTCLVYVPRDRLNAEVTRRVASILEQEIGGSISDQSTQFADAHLARLHFVIATVSGGTSEIAVNAIERRLTEALRTWVDRLSETLMRVKGTDDAAASLRRYATAFPPSYVERFGVDVAVQDMAELDAVASGIPVAVRLDNAPGAEFRLKVFHLAEPVALSDVLPMLENLGMRVVNEIPFEVTPRGVERPVWIQEFELRAKDSQGSALEDMKGRFEEAFRQVWNGVLESDGFNRLVLTAGFSAREVVVLRAYCKMLRQTGSNFSQSYMEDTANAHPTIARLLVDLFVARADPATASADRDARVKTITARIGEALEVVAVLDEDRILRGFLLLIEKTLRTTYFQRDDEGQPKRFLAFKLASREIDLLPLPRPLVEIFVYSPRMEGCHLRGGKVARGGIRWSDRKEDFRTEILGLMKAQMVKNAVIVPIGSKGGFVVKRPPEGGSRDAIMAEGIACYKILMAGLLDLTDDIRGSTVVPPPDVVRHDPDDTYLVVAADKGTATFSDIANGVAIEHGFWLGDAFASGGSVGYDHKVMGITAKGAWEAVKRHFREIGTDIQTTDFTCVGVGDMSGDVFGNGMLLSRHTKLLAAFNHMHIFVDPDPHPERSWIERARIFALPRSGWNDYDTSVLSEGGAIYERSAKSVTLSPQACSRFGLPASPMSPSQLIQALLRQDVDLLWFGGIGTYVKATTENHGQAGDRANDALRVDAPSLRAKVVGEGANLAVTQRARIEYALQGGRINTDAIDNSAGVDTSDHEVNIKIAVGDAIDAGLITPAERRLFLASMTDDVEHHVLRDNYLQTLALTLTQSRAAALLDTHARLMRGMERAGRLDRAVEFLPDDEALAQRAAGQCGLTRPEIAVLLAYVKNGLYEELLASGLPDIPELRSELLGYFPSRLRDVAGESLRAHRLRREIVATVVANALVNRMGPSFVEESRLRTSRDAAAVATAFLVVRDIFDLGVIWTDIELLDNQVQAATQTRLLLAVAEVVDRAVAWFLLSGLPLELGELVARFRPGLHRLALMLDDLLPERERQVNAGRLGAHMETGAPEHIARRIVVLVTLSSAMDIIRLSEDTATDIVAVGRAYFATGVDFGLLTLRRRARSVSTTTPWQHMAVDAMIEDAYAQQRDIVRRRLGGEISESDIVRRAGPNTPLADVLGEIGRTTPPDLAMLMVAGRRIREAAG